MGYHYIGILRFGNVKLLLSVEDYIQDVLEGRL